jgi:4-amino-4-deoxy-L-arabinose transferase-like glycosyltransferase
VNSAGYPRPSSEPAVFWAPWLATAIVLAWIALMLASDSGLYGDNIEQVVWAHSMEWGYHKHPPLPTWILGGAIALFGPAWWWTDVLAGLCLVGTLWLTWSIARRLAGDTVAAATALLWGLLQCFSSRVQLYNHNTVLVLCIAFTVWCALRATDGQRGWWLGVGIGAGLAMLAKYQAAVPLAALLLLLAVSGRLKATGQKVRAGLAVLLALLVFAPHLAWVASHDFSTLRYASQSVESAGIGRRLQFDLSFLVNQLRMVLPALAAFGICLLLARGKGRTVPDAVAATGADPGLAIWLRGLFWGLLAFLLLLPLVAGINLRNHWGVQTFQFFALWLAWRWQRRWPIRLGQLAVVALLLHAVSMVVYVTEVRGPQAMAAARRIDNAFPGRRMADAALVQWRSVTNCPLRYVAGDFEAGLVSAYSQSSPVVFVSAAASPWVDQTDLRQRGAMYAVPALADLPPGTVAVRDLDLSPEASPVPGARHVVLGVQAPAAACP